jgi:hypothetical protein
MGDQPVTRPLPTQDSVTQKNADMRPCLERDSNPRSKTVRTLDRAAIGAGKSMLKKILIFRLEQFTIQKHQFLNKICCY